MALFINNKSSRKEFKNNTDEELILEYKKDSDILIIGEIFKRYTHLAYGVCMKYLQNEDDSKDAVMQIFEKLIFDLENNDILNFKNWLYSVSKNHCLMFLRKEKTINKVKEEIKIDYVENFMENEDDEHLYNELKNNELLQEAMKSLTIEQNECIDLFYLKEKSYKEVVEITGHDLKKVKSYIQNGKRNLKIYLGKNNGN